MNIPRIHLANLPTPVEPMPRLSAELKGPVMFVKRDDLTGLAFGGNKTRKLETLLAEARANGARTLVTAGAIQSNHCRQTAAAAARLGYGCVLVLSGQPDPMASGNLLLDGLLGARVVWCSREDREAVLQRTFEEAWAAGQRPYLIPYGGSSPVGAAAYALAMQEFLAQNETVDWIVFPTSSGGTQAGLVAGARMDGWQGKILGISVDESARDLCPNVASLAAETASRLGESINFSPEEILVNDDFLGAGYAMPGEPEMEAIRLFARLEGLLVDPVYTGRAAAGLIGLIRTGFFKPGERVLFWHTGGTPALFAGLYLQQLGSI